MAVSCRRQLGPLQSENIPKAFYSPDVLYMPDNTILRPLLADLGDPWGDLDRGGETPWGIRHSRRGIPTTDTPSNGPHSTAKRYKARIQKRMRLLTAALRWEASFMLTTVGSSFTLTAPVLSFPFPLSLCGTLLLIGVPFSPSCGGWTEAERESAASSESTCMAEGSGSATRCDDDDAISSSGVVASSVEADAWLLRADARCERVEAELNRDAEPQVRRQGSVGVCGGGNDRR